MHVTDYILYKYIIFEDIEKCFIAYYYVSPIWQKLDINKSPLH